MVNDLARSVDNWSQIDAILLDFSWAFDKVSHSRLLRKLEHYGIRNSTLSWITDFLQGRIQDVLLDGQTSSESPVTSGVPLWHNHWPSVVSNMTYLADFGQQSGCLLMTVCCTETFAV